MLNNVLTQDDIQMRAPSAFAAEPWHKQSDRYAFVPTSAVIDGLRANGFLPVKAEQSRSRIEGKSSFTKHMIRFRAAGQNVSKVGDSALETILINSHDGTSCYELSMGVFRSACLNGLVIAESLVGSVKIRHTGDIIGRVIDESSKLLENSGKIVETIETWKRIILSPAEQLILAEGAHAVRFEETDQISAALPAQRLLQARRSDDAPSDLWSVFNRVQENTIRGGIRVNGPNQRLRSREVKGIDQNLKLNRALWELAAKMAELKSN